MQLGDKPAVSGGDPAATFHDFTIKYLHERLCGIFRKRCIEDQRDQYVREKIVVPFEESQGYRVSDIIVDLIDKQASQNTVLLLTRFSTVSWTKHHFQHASNLEARVKEPRGLFWLLDEEAIFPGASDESFVDRISAHYAPKCASSFM